MGCACQRQSIKCSMITDNTVQHNMHPTDPNVSESGDKKIIKSSIIDCDLAAISGKMNAIKAKNNSKFGKMKCLEDTLICHILTYAFSTKMIKNYIRTKRKLKDVSVPKNYADQAKDFYNLVTSNKRIHKLINLMFNRPGHLCIANNHTIVVSKMFSLVGNDDESNLFYKKGRSLSPRSLLYTSNKLPDIKNFNNYATIKDIADDVDHEQHYIRRISKFKSFG